MERTVTQYPRHFRHYLRTDLIPNFSGLILSFHIYICVTTDPHHLNPVRTSSSPCRKRSALLKSTFQFHFLLAITQMVDIYNRNHQRPWGNDVRLKMVTVTVARTLAIQPTFTQYHYQKIGSSAPSNHCESLTSSIHK